MNEQESFARLPARNDINATGRNIGFTDRVGRNLAVDMAVPVQGIFPIRLQKRFYATGRAISANIYRGFSGLHRCLAAHGDATSNRLVKFVLVKVAHLIFKCAQPFFELTFALGQRKLLILERETLALNVNHAVVHVADDFVN